MYRTGHSLIKAKMKEEHAELAGEMSGHMFFADRYFGYDDALYAACRLIEIVANSGKPLSAQLEGLPKTVSLTGALGAGLPTAALTQLYRTLTLPELAALVRALTGQGAVSSAAGQTLIDYLRKAALASTPEARAAALAQFVKDAGSLVTGPASKLLTVAGGALTG